MTQHQFSALSKSQQRIYLLTEGTFLAERHTALYDLMLYDLHGVYVEAAFIKNSNRVAYFKVLEKTDSLTPYLADVDVEGLLQELPF